MSARLLIEACGLSQREAADYLDVRLDTVKNWFKPNPVNARDGVLDELRALHGRQRRAAASQIALIRSISRQQGSPGVIELALSTDDHEARSKGWPCVGAEMRTYAMVAARITTTIRLVPRGSTLATARAADEVDKSC